MSGTGAKGAGALTPRQLAIKLATRHAVEAAGGQVFVAGELGRAQSRVSDWCSEHRADFIPADLITPLEALGAGRTGHPHITRALARQQGGVLGSLPVDPDRGREDLGAWLAAIAAENADLTSALADQDLARCAGQLSQRARAGLVRETDELIAQLQAFRAVLDNAPRGRRRGSDTS